MFGNLGVHVHRFPSGRFGFVGTLPASLGDAVLATRNDVMAGRAFRGGDGRIMTIKFPTFKTERAALAFARARVVEVSNA